jgi:putative ABC transport system permease protein
MIKNYLKVAWRTLRRNGSYTLLNTFGLAVGIGVCLLIGLYVRHEWSYDRFYDNADQIARIVQSDTYSEAFGLSSARVLEGTATTPPGLAQALQRRVPGIAQTTVVGRPSRKLLSRDDEQFYIDEVVRADTSFFETFSFELLRGDPQTVLDAPGRIVLTPSLAQRLFGDADPMGKTVVCENERKYEVAGIVSEPPVNTHFSFNAFLSLSESQREVRYGDTVRWRFFGDYLYLKLRPSVDPKTVEDAVRSFERTAERPARQQAEVQLRIQSLTDIHLYSSQLQDDIAPQGNVRYLYFFGLIGLAILLIACVNYVNLATAQAARRAREVGVRKTVGAARGQLIGQFLGEAVLLAVLALPLALGGVRLMLPVVNDIAGTTLRLQSAPLVEWMGAAIGLVGVVGLVAGIYPAFLLSRFRPAEVLTTSGRGSRSGGAPWFRRGLVVFQFAASVALILAALVVQSQLDYVQDKRLGFDEERIVTFDKSPLGKYYGTLKEELRRQTAVRAVTAGNPPGIGHKIMTIPVENKETGEKQRVAMMYVDSNYVKTLGLDVLQGRSFASAHLDDQRSSVILTESAINAYGLGSDPVGKTISWPMGDDSRTTIGVVEDFHNESLHELIHPVVLALEPSRTRTVLAALAPGATEQGLDALRSTWRQFVPDRPLSAEFLDQQIEAQYRAEQRLATLFGLFAALAIGVACLGLYGLAAYAVRRRTREIGIRKALGASATHIVGLLSKEYVALLGVALVLGLPLAYAGLQRWLQNFAYRIDLGTGVFAVSAGLAVGIAALTVSVHALHAARTDPATAIRQE